MESNISVYHYILLGIFHFYVDDNLTECIGRVDARFAKSKILQTRGILNVTFKSVFGDVWLKDRRLPWKPLNTAFYLGELVQPLTDLSL